MWQSTITPEDLTKIPAGQLQPARPEISPTRLTGHRQITDAWLAELARRKGGKLVTLDEALYVLWPDVTFLVPV